MFPTHRSYLAAVLFALLPAAAPAADSLAVAVRPHSLLPGNRALVFEIGEFLKLEAFNRMGIAVKLQHSRTRATRISLTARHSHTDMLHTYELDPPDDHRTDQLYTVSALDADVLRLHYREAAGSIHPFWGWGPVMKADRRKLDQDRLDSAEEGEDRSTYDAVDVSLGGGLKTVLGAEWFATREISLHAEYGLTLVYTRAWTRDTAYSRTATNGLVQTGDDLNTRNSLDLRALPVTFGLSVYF